MDESDDDDDKLASLASEDAPAAAAAWTLASGSDLTDETLFTLELVLLLLGVAHEVGARVDFKSLDIWLVYHASNWATVSSVTLTKFSPLDRDMSRLCKREKVQI